MRYGSVCSGVEAATLAWHHLGWKPVFFSEVEPFPCAVLQERLGASAPINPLAPEEAVTLEDYKMRESWIKQNNLLKKEGIIPNEGDFTKIGNKYAGKIDLLVGGTPCQDLSVAGKRAGFEGERSSLAIDFVRLAYESKCKYIVWENVPGVFSSNGGRDFATFLSLLSGAEVEVPVNGWGTAGFVCNARPDRYGLSWRTLDGQFTKTSRFPFAVPQRRRRVFVVGYFGDWTRAAKVLLEPERLYWDTPTRFKARERITGLVEKSTGTAGTNNAVNFASSSFGNYSETDFGGTLKSSGGDLAGGSENLSVAVACDMYNHFINGDVSKTLNAAASDADHVPTVIEKKQSTVGVMGVSQNMTVRRLLPIECERLMGFPDNWTQIPWRGKPAEDCPDAPRYKACGNSMCVNVMQWIGEQIERVEKEMNNG